MTDKVSTVFIVGATASGKSSLAMELAREIGRAEIVCADSQTIRRHLDIGTAKPSKQDQKEVPHSMIDIIEPYAEFSVNQFKELAEKAINDIQARGNLPIIVGGTGLYIDALYYDFDISVQDEKSEYKNELEQKSVLELQEIISKKGYELPENYQNPRHLIGIILRDGKVRINQEPIAGSKIYGIDVSSENQKDRISKRIDKMYEDGLVDEVKELIKKYGKPERRMDAIGYPIVMDYLDEKISQEESKQKFAQGHWQYAKRQKAWFKRNDNIQWSSNPEQLLEMLIKDIN